MAELSNVPRQTSPPLAKVTLQAGSSCVLSELHPDTPVTEVEIQLIMAMLGSQIAKVFRDEQDT